MKTGLIFPLMVIGTFASLPTMAAVYTTWPVGLEREVDEGVYMSVVAQQDGWRIWKTETKSGFDCRAVKSAKGRTHPIPVGVGGALFGGTPYLGIYRDYKQQITYSWFTEHYDKVRIKIRQSDQKFWDEYDSRPDMAKYGEEIINVVASSWEYPEIYVGYVEEKAFFDLKGRGWAIDKVDECAAKKNS
jgi:hypothetical protein